MMGITAITPIKPTYLCKKQNAYFIAVDITTGEEVAKGTAQELHDAIGIGIHSVSKRASSGDIFMKRYRIERG